MSQERRLICVPPDDAVFVAAVEDAFATLGRAGQSDEELGAAVKASLRAHYPGVRLRSRDTIADYLPGGITWYVYRDRGSGDAKDVDRVPNGGELSPAEFPGLDARNARRRGLRASARIGVVAPRHKRPHSE